MHNFWRQSQKWLLEQLTCRFAEILRPNHFPYEKVFGATAWGFKKVGVFRTFNVQMLPNSLLDTCTQTAHFVQNKTWRRSQFLKDLLLLFALAASRQSDDILCLDWKIWPPFQHLSRKPKDNQSQCEAIAEAMWSHGVRQCLVMFGQSIRLIRHQKKTEEPNDFPGALVLGSDPPRCAPRSPGGVQRTVNVPATPAAAASCSSNFRVGLTQLRGTLGLSQLSQLESTQFVSNRLVFSHFETASPAPGKPLQSPEIDSTTACHIVHAHECMNTNNAMSCESWTHPWLLNPTWKWKSTLQTETKWSG